MTPNEIFSILLSSVFRAYPEQCVPGRAGERGVGAVLFILWTQEGKGLSKFQILNGSYKLTDLLYKIFPTLFIL